ncbi:MULTISPECIES: D-Ala-D-Ala carboxypeptidase family metallohydrolase [unclassified Burkholderia]|uniref:D-Ala-D-Ala carboxypeptidase family metallohydrolase n=1 Tax=unclassified Burkholderia TaxID=2613784 RepID=UPI0014215EBB|nr:MULTISPECIES: D-Ala-D-Ala carboxypeptidase family metallohydrolase [unclassified Burkholderia]NIE82690.1 peptidase M15 [Burkholderia sp. Tr-860]NIF61809.1 peptidase M15 [Burkholderia sp. Cy-647]NIF94922.1 peptidase M15 [Burkholderia sp. Ax-1720]
MKLTDHFTLSELTQSETAARRRIDNTPSSETLVNLTRTAQLLEKVRAELGDKPVLISSGYRCHALNRAVGGATNSAHGQGLAADFICPGFGSPLDICKRLAAARIEFDQLIQEGTWVHIGLAAAGKRPRHQVLTAHFGTGATRYTTGL